MLTKHSGILMYLTLFSCITFMGCTSTVKENKKTEIQKIDNLPVEVYINQHRNYIKSSKYALDISEVSDSEAMSSIYRDIEDNKAIKTYSALNELSSILELNSSDLTIEDQYELLLSQILFNTSGEKSLNEVYVDNYENVFIELGNIIISYLNEEEICKSDDLKSIVENYQKLKSYIIMDRDVNEIEETIESFLDAVQFYDSLPFREYILGNAFDSPLLFSTVSLISDEIDIVKYTLSEFVLYTTTINAYSETNEIFTEVLLSMRKQLNVKSDNPLFKSDKHTDIVSQNDLNNLLGLTWIDKFNPFVDPGVDIKILSKVLERYYLILEESKYGTGTNLANAMLEDFRDKTEINLWEQGVSSVSSFFSYLQVVQKYEVLKTIISYGKTFMEIFTNVEDQAFNADMLLKVKCLTYIIDRVVDKISKYDWDKTPKDYEGSLLEYQLEVAQLFDEAVCVYKSSLITELLYGKKYLDDVHDENEAYNHNLTNVINYDLELLEKIRCHNIYNIDELVNTSSKKNILMDQYLSVLTNMEWLLHANGVEEVSVCTIDLNGDSIDELIIQILNNYKFDYVIYSYDDKAYFVSTLEGQNRCISFSPQFNALLTTSEYWEDEAYIYKDMFYRFDKKKLKNIFSIIRCEQDNFDTYFYLSVPQVKEKEEFAFYTDRDELGKKEAFEKYNSYIYDSVAFPFE